MTGQDEFGTGRGAELLEPQIRSWTVPAPATALQISLTLHRQLDQKDRSTSGHCQRLSNYALAMGEQLRLSATELEALHIGGIVHDIGKLAVPDSILHKPAPLESHEWAVMRLHPIVGERLCACVAALRPALGIVRHHHERWDGSGYPDHLSGERIPLVARIVQIVDVFDALTSARPYKPAWSAAQALVTMQREAEHGWLDQRLFREFTRMMRVR